MFSDWLIKQELEEIQRNTESDHMEADVRVTSGSEDAAQRIELETTDETEEHETAAESDSSVGNEISVQDLCNTMRREGVSEDDIDLVKLVLEEREKGNAPPDNLRNVDRKILKQHVAKINGILKYIPTKDITDMNNLLLAVGRVVQIKVGMKKKEMGRQRNHYGKEDSSLRCQG